MSLEKIMLDNGFTKNQFEIICEEIYVEDSARAHLLTAAPNLVIAGLQVDLTLDVTNRDRVRYDFSVYEKENSSLVVAHLNGVRSSRKSSKKMVKMTELCENVLAQYKSS